MQKYKSSVTSINSSKLPVLFKKVYWESGKKNLDYGGGKFDNVAEYLLKLGVYSVVYDPFNRSEEHNKKALSTAPFDTISVSNVLNVILERDERIKLLKHCKELLKEDGKIYITTYIGNGTSIPTTNEVRNTCQLNRPLKEYIEEVLEVFPNVKIKKGVIEASLD